MQISNNTLKIHYTLRIAAAMCFIGHGAFGIITKPIWCNYFALFGIDKVNCLSFNAGIGICGYSAGYYPAVQTHPGHCSVADFLGNYDGFMPSAFRRTLCVNLLKGQAILAPLFVFYYSQGVFN